MHGRVIVVGGGIGGLSAACAVSDAGWSVRVLERGPELSEEGAGLSLWGNGIEALDRLGVGGSIRAVGLTGSSSSFRVGRDPGRSGEAHAKDLPPVLAVDRRDLQRVLLDGCRERGVEILDRTSVVDVDTNAGQVGTVHCGDGSEYAAELVVAADGIGSAVRRRVFPDYAPSRSTGLRTWRWIVEAEDVDAHRAEFEAWAPASLLGVGQEFGIVPLSGGRLYCFASSATRRDGTVATLDSYARWPGPFSALVDAGVRSGVVIERDVCDLPCFPTYVRGCVVLVGDAAHAMTPHLGQGACQALEDAVILGEALTATSTRDEALEAYDRRRVPRAHAVQRGSRSAMAIMTMTNPLACALRDGLMTRLPSRVLSRPLGRWVDTSHLSLSGESRR